MVARLLEAFTVTTHGANPSGRGAHRASNPQPRREQAWGHNPPVGILARYPPDKTDPFDVLEILIRLFNTRHTAMEKTVSFKTRQERAFFLRRFFRDLKEKAGFSTPPDPRNLNERHIRAMVAVWRQEKLAPATIQTYFSFLRGLAAWLDKPGLIRTPDFYGMKAAEYRRCQNA